ncbi:type VI secretion system tip protein VgrG [Pedobacter sp. 22226]|uniref:type VI secretion system tip protein VgrG n=1 Tax=Pedobacter sp. 22226 TaxID=3453894 RepID=UPI003F84A762
MTSSTNITSSGNASYTIKVAGITMPENIQIKSIRVEKKVNQITSAKIIIIDGEASSGAFEASSSSLFVPGNLVSIEAGYDGTNALIFKGIITGQSIRINDMVGSVLEVECKDEAIKMTVGKKNLIFSGKKDSELIASLISNYSSLTADISDTNAIWPEQVQFYVSDWDFILSLAETNGLIVTTINGNVAVKSPVANASPVLSIGYGVNLLEFNAGINAINQYGNVKSNSWDYQQQAVVSVCATNSYVGPGNMSSKKLAEVVGLAEYDLQTTAAIDTAALNNWARAQMVKSEFAKIQGEAKFQGNALAEPGKFVAFNGLGDRFNGDYLISGVVHDISDGNWITEVSLGLSPQWFTGNSDLAAPSATGMLPGVRGLFNGIVKKTYGDPDSQYRILVDLPLFGQSGQGVWARLANFYSTSGAGAFFLPEAGDEVVLGFLNEDPRSPVILGSMYSSSKIKPHQNLNPNEKNAIKAIVSKSNIKIEFDDENKMLTIATPDKNTMIFSDQDKKITIQDEHNNSLVMSAGGITIKSATDVNIEAAQKVNIMGNQGVTVKAPAGDVALKGLNIKQVADSQFLAEGAATAEIKSGMQLSLKSAMIMIN